MTVMLQWEWNLQLIFFYYGFISSDWACISSYKFVWMCYTKYGLAYQKITVEKIQIFIVINILLGRPWFEYNFISNVIILSLILQRIQRWQNKNDSACKVLESVTPDQETHSCLSNTFCHLNVSLLMVIFRCDQLKKNTCLMQPVKYGYKFWVDDNESISQFNFNSGKFGNDIERM
jgi:hypothetical protein